MPKTTRFPMFIIDAFVGAGTKGNPAAVCLVGEEQLTDEAMQDIAAEMNLSETAFVWFQKNNPASVTIRWFTPTVEIPLCGHATLAAAYVLLQHVFAEEKGLSLKYPRGVLRVDRGEGENLRLALPVRAFKAGPVPDGMLAAIGVSEIIESGMAANEDFVLRLPDGSDLSQIRVDFAALKATVAPGKCIGVIVTTKGPSPSDFSSRFFAPWIGIDEDPVTGAAHAALGPFWSSRLGKTRMQAWQRSARQGRLNVDIVPDQGVVMEGVARTFLEGHLNLAGAAENDRS